MSGKRPLKVRHFASELAGGTGVAALRLHGELMRQGVDSRLHHRFGSSSAKQVEADQRHRSSFWRLLQGYVIGRRWRQQNPERGVFIHARWIFPTRLSDFGPVPEVLNLHLVFRWLDLPSFLSSIPAGLPVVWSLHDLHPATGGCIHPLECDRYTTHCHDCPNLKQAAKRDRAWREFNLKDRLYQRLNLHIVGNSEWTTAQARRSALMRHAKSFHTIPLGLDIRAYAPVEKSCARQAFGMAAHKFVVGFACADFSDRNKGGALLLEALRALSQETQITLLAFGGGKLPECAGKCEVMELGSIHSSELQSIFYSACDVFVVPSRIESFGLTALEAMACGTPLVAYQTGGLADLVMDGVTGLLEKEVGSVPGLTRLLQWVWKHPTERIDMGVAARQRVVQQFSDSLMAQRYLELYQKLLLPAKDLPRGKRTPDACI